MDTHARNVHYFATDVERPTMVYELLQFSSHFVVLLPLLLLCCVWFRPFDQGYVCVCECVRARIWYRGEYVAAIVNTWMCVLVCDLWEIVWRHTFNISRSRVSIKVCVSTKCATCTLQMRTNEKKGHRQQKRKKKRWQLKRNWSVDSNNWCGYVIPSDWFIYLERKKERESHLGKFGDNAELDEFSNANAIDCFEATVFIVLSAGRDSWIRSSCNSKAISAELMQIALFVWNVRLSTSKMKWMQQSVESWNCARHTLGQPTGVDDFATVNPIEWDFAKENAKCEMTENFHGKDLYPSREFRKSSQMHTQGRQWLECELFLRKNGNTNTNTIVFTALVFSSIEQWETVAERSVLRS